LVKEGNTILEFWDTVEGTMLAGGAASLTIRYLHMTNKGESVMGTGTNVSIFSHDSKHMKVGSFHRYCHISSNT